MQDTPSSPPPVPQPPQPPELPPGYGLETPFWSSWMSYAWPLVLLLQLACVLHVVRTGRPYWWFWIVMGFPMIGVAAYVLLEMRPSWSRLNFAAIAWRLKTAAQRIQIRQDELVLFPTIRNRLRLAEELHADRQFDSECRVLEEGLRGAFSDDTTLLTRLAEAHLEAGRVEAAADTLAKRVAKQTADEEAEFNLIRARVLCAQGHFVEAEPMFRQLFHRRRNEGPRYYLAAALHQVGRSDEAIELLQDICTTYRRGTNIWRALEKPWYVAAKSLLKRVMMESK